MTSSPLDPDWYNLTGIHTVQEHSLSQKETGNPWKLSTTTA